MAESYSRADLARLFVEGLTSGDVESTLVAVQAARASGIPLASLAGLIHPHCGRLRVDAAVALGRHGGADLLIRLLEGAGWEARADAAKALGKVGGNAARDALERAASDPDDWVQICARRALTSLPAQPHVEALAALTPRGRTIAALLLGRASQLALADCVAFLDHAAAPIRRAVRDVIVDGGSPARDALFEALREQPRGLSKETVDFIGKLGDPRGVKPLLRTAASAPRNALNAIIVAARTLVMSRHPDAVSALVDALTEMVEGRAASEPLASVRDLLRNVGSPAAAGLLRAFTLNPSVRRSEGALLGQVLGARAIPVLIDAFLDVYRAVRSSAVAGLQAVGPVAVPVLLELFDAPGAPVERKRDVVSILAVYRDPRGLAALLWGLTDVLPAVRTSSADALAHIGPPAVPPLVDMVQSSANGAATRRLAIEVLGALGEPDAIEVLGRIVDAPLANDDDRETAIVSLGGFRDDRAVAILRRLVHDNKDQEPALKGLARLAAKPPYPSALLPLVTDLAIGARPTVRRHAFVLLRSVWSGANVPVRMVVPTVIALFADAESELVEAVIEYLAGVPEARPFIAEALASATGVLHPRLRRALAAIDAAGAQRTHPAPAPSLRMGVHLDAMEPSAPLSPLSPQRTVPISITHDVHLSVSAPVSSEPGAGFMLGVWIHQGRGAVWKWATQQQRGASTHVESRGPVRVPNAAEITVQLSIPDYGVEGLTDSIYWSGDATDAIGNCAFPIVVPVDAAPGVHFGRVVFRLGALNIATLDFALHAGRPTEIVEDMTSSETRFRTAFASYTSDDRARVMARVQGMLKLLPELDVFVDVITLHAGERWAERIEQEILARDAFLLFWSVAASRSQSVEHEWRTALRTKGLDAISPVPLDPPATAPPPPELSSLHFSDPTLAFERL